MLNYVIVGEGLEGECVQWAAYSNTFNFTHFKLISSIHTLFASKAVSFSNSKFWERVKSRTKLFNQQCLKINHWSRLQDCFYSYFLILWHRALHIWTNCKYITKVKLWQPVGGGMCDLLRCKLFAVCMERVRDKVRESLPMEQQVNCALCQMAYTTLFCQSVGAWLWNTPADTLRPVVGVVYHR